MTVGATLVASLLVTLARPATWPLALATFLVRGGFLLVLAPIVVLPTAVELGNLLSPVLTTLLFRGVTPYIALLQVAGGVGFLLWLLVGGLIAAAAETEIVRQVAADDDVRGLGQRSALAPAAQFTNAGHTARRVLSVRVAASLPLLLVALPWGAFRFVAVGYDELTSPTAGGLPLAARIALGAPDAVALLVVAWLVGEIVGGLAARRVVLAGTGVRGALRWATHRLARRPLRISALSLGPLVPLAVILGIAGMAGSATWDALRAALSVGGDRLVALVLLLLLVAMFTGGLLLIGVASAWRAAIWTVDVAGTFGATVHDPEGQWHGVADSGTLADLRPRGVDPDTR